jgi:hypothetical protein
MKRGIKRWEHSGQGDGGFLDKDAPVDKEEDVRDEEGEDDSHDGVGHRFGRLKKQPQ